MRALLTRGMRLGRNALPVERSPLFLGPFVLEDTELATGIPNVESEQFGTRSRRPHKTR
jgi:hypothetical protein